MSRSVLITRLTWVLPLTLLSASVVHAQTPSVVANPRASEFDRFGTSVDVDGDVAIVGAPNERTGGVWTGAAYVYRRAGGEWALDATLLPVGFSAFGETQFGASVAVSGNVAVVAAPAEWVNYQSGDANTRGVVYVFRRGASGTWALEAELAQAPFGDLLYGLDVAVEGNTLVVGAKDRFVGPPGQGGGGGALTGDGPSASRAGDICHGNGVYELSRAEVVRFDGAAWVRTDSLAVPDGLIGSGFGVSVSLDGDAVVVGAPLWYTSPLCGDAVDADDIGRAYVFRRTGDEWVFEATLAPAGLADGDQFGADVAASGDRVVVGAPYRDGVSLGSGAAFSFGYGSGAWVQEAEFVGVGTAQLDQFGAAVALQGDYAVVGAPRFRNGAINLGATYGFRYAGGAWQQGFRVTVDDDTAPTTNSPIWFALGGAVALDGGHVAIGAPQYGLYGPTLARDIGRAYTYTLAEYFGVSTASGATPAGTEASLGPAMPNPTTARAALSLSVDAPQHVRATVYDALGRAVAVVLDAEVAASAEVSVDASGLAPGVYVVRVEGESFAFARRFTVTR
jgi:hypothetical protein